MTRLTPKQRDILARMEDGEWYLGADLSPNAPGLLGMLALKGLIRDDLSYDTFATRNWTITPDGIAALKASE